jgi:hypothetical protein
MELEGKSQNAKGKSQNELLHFAFCLLTFDFNRVFPLCLGDFVFPIRIRGPG